MRSLRVFFGIAVWAGLLGAAAWSIDRRVAEEGYAPQDIRDELTKLVQTPRNMVRLSSGRSLRFTEGDPVFATDDAGDTHQIGEVTACFTADGQRGRSAFATEAEVLLYDNVNPAEFVLVHYTSPDSLAATFATMLPPKKRVQIANEIRRAFEQNRHEVVAQLKPIVEKSVRESVKVIERELAAAIRRHRGELTDLSAKYQRDLVKTEVVPLVKKEVLPIVQKHAQPLAEDIGKTLWGKVSLWSFGWRYIADKTPLTDKDRVKKEWARFVKREIIPEMERRSDDIVKSVQRILNDASKNPKVRSAVRRNLSKVIEDPAVHRLIWKLVREVMIESPRVREVLEKNWQSPEARRAFQLASERFEPTAVRIGEMLFGTPDGGITPEFASVLRRQILHKDQRWLILRERTETDPPVSGSGAITVLAGGESEDYPGRLRGAE